jgi:predicted dehydrogenase
MTEQTLRIGLIGLGGVALAHWEAYRMETWIKVVSVCDIRQDVVDHFCKESGAQGFTEVSDLLDFGGIDLALVLTPALTHRALCEQVARAGIHVFCEKPIALNREDARAVLKTCKQEGVQFFYGSCYRYLPAVSKARELILDGKIGNVKLLSEQLTGGAGPAHYHDYGPAHYPVGGPGGPGAGLVDHGVHLIDVMPWMCGTTITDVSGTGVVSGEGAGVEHMVMRMANGAEGHLLYYSASWFTDLPGEAHMSEGMTWAIDGSFKAPGELDPHPGVINVFGDAGALRIYHYANAVYLFNDDGTSRIPLEGRATPRHFATQLEDCASAIFTGSTPRVSGEDGLQALDLLLRVYGL